MRIIKPRRIKPRGHNPDAILNSKYSGEVTDFEYAMDITKYLYFRRRDPVDPATDLHASDHPTEAYLTLSRAEAVALCVFIIVSLLFLI